MAHVGCIEFQELGLPHAHILIFFVADCHINFEMCISIRLKYIFKRVFSGSAPLWLPQVELDLRF